MHELGIVERLAEAVNARAAAAGSVRVRSVELEVGDDAGVDLDSIALHWPIVASGTLADNAVLRFVPAGSPRALRVVAIDVEDGSGTTD
jgi:Zn finger protein HypA/HybF involved in hydrogenase expression